jgi:hypothetical protein
VLALPLMLQAISDARTKTSRLVRWPGKILLAEVSAMQAEYQCNTSIVTNAGCYRPQGKLEESSQSFMGKFVL